MKYFIDTEFMESVGSIELLSLALVCEDGRQLYIEFTDAEKSHANDWVRENVLPHLWDQGNFEDIAKWSEPNLFGAPMNKESAKYTILEFIGIDTPEFWGESSAYDWVAFCWLFGDMSKLPAGWPTYCNDITQLWKSLGEPTLPPNRSLAHHAMCDAHWIDAAWKCMQPEGKQMFFTSERLRHLARTISSDAACSEPDVFSLAKFKADAIRVTAYVLDQQ